MTVKSKDWLHRNAINITTLVAIFGVFISIRNMSVGQAKWQQEITTKIVALEAHVIDKDDHVPLDKKIQMFIPRTEQEKTNAEIISKLDLLLVRELQKIK